MTGPVSIDAAHPEDALALLAVEGESFSHPWTLQQLQQAIGGSGGGGTVLVLRGVGDGQPEIVGYCAYHVVTDELHVHNLAVLPELRRRGYGRRLLAACVEDGVRRGARKGFLEVRAGNQGALALYGSSGFERVGVRRGYYSQPPEDAVLLEHSNLPGFAGLVRSR